MAGIDDLMTIYRGEAPSRSGMAKGFGERSGRYFTPRANMARYWAQGGSQTLNNLVGDLKGNVKSLKIPLSKYKELGGNSLQVILDDDSIGKAKKNLFQTFLARAGSLTPLAMKGLKYLSSLPAATAMMFLQSTPANADEANMKLEDFAKLNKGNTNIDKPLYDD